MKKTILLIATAVAFMFIGCGSGGGGDTVSRLDKNTTEDSSVDSDSYVDNDADVNNDTSDGLRAHGVRLKSEYQSSNNGSNEFNTTYEYDSLGRLVNMRGNVYINKKFIVNNISVMHYKDYQLESFISKTYDDNGTLINEGSLKNFYNNLKQLTKSETTFTYYKDPASNRKIIETVESWDGVYETKKNTETYDSNNILLNEQAVEIVWDGDIVSKYTVKDISYEKESTVELNLDVDLYYDAEGRKYPSAYKGENDTYKYGKHMSIDKGYLIEKIIITDLDTGNEIPLCFKGTRIFNEEGLVIRENLSADAYIIYTYENY